MIWILVGFAVLAVLAAVFAYAAVRVGAMADARDGVVREEDMP